MKRILLLCLLLTSLTATVKAANKESISKIAIETTFCDGWKDGYEAGYSYYNITNHKPKPIFITPICPIAKAGLDSYQDGYNCGLIEGKKDFKKRNPNIEDDNSHPLAIPVIENDDERSFCDGWKAGFEAGYTYYNVTNKKSKPIFITPICPTAQAGSNRYQDGYNRGLVAGRKKFRKRNRELNLSEDNDDKVHVYHKKRTKKDTRSYCDGWEDGYEDGYTYESTIKRRIKPIFITPICPIAKIGADTYQNGYDRGRRQGLKDFKDR